MRVRKGMWRMSLVALSWLSLAAASSSAPPVATRMRHVVFHIGPGIALQVDAQAVVVLHQEELGD